MSGAGESSKDTGPMLPGFETCETATEALNSLGLWPTPTSEVSLRTTRYAQGGKPLGMAVSQALTSSAAASPASPSVTPADAQENPIAAGFGLSLQESYAKWDPDGCSSKTSPVCGVSPPSNPGLLTDAYAAGLFDGEGCVYIATKGNRWFYPRTDVGMTTKGKALLDMMCQKYGGKVRKFREATDKWEAAWTWNLLNRDTEPFLRAIQPHLVIKQEQVRLVLKFLEMHDALPKRPRKGNQKVWTDEAIEAARAMRAEIQSLNKTGPQHSRQPGWFARVVGGVWITPQLSLLPGLPWEKFSGPWPRSGILRRGSVYPLPTSGRPTSASESSLWPTPNVRDYKDVGVNTDYEKVARKSKLAGVVMTRMWPSPTKADGERGSLVYQGNHNPTLKGAVGGQLNPTWVEWLMGFPLGWTDLGDSATPSSRRSRK